MALESLWIARKGNVGKHRMVGWVRSLRQKGHDCDRLISSQTLSSATRTCPELCLLVVNKAYPLCDLNSGLFLLVGRDRQGLVAASPHFRGSASWEARERDLGLGIFCCSGTLFSASGSPAPASPSDHLDWGLIRLTALSSAPHSQGSAGRLRCSRERGGGCHGP